jgi:hypothetical protein
MDKDKNELITKAQAEEAIAKAVAEALAKAEKEKEEAIAKAVAEASAKAEKEKEEAVKAKEKEVRYEMYQEMLAYRRRKIPCRNYVPRYAGWRTQ